MLDKRLPRDRGLGPESDPDRCLALFKSDRDAGLILFAGMLLDAFVRTML